ncbi:hypothetical protein KEM55_005531, partial [Ascosphaera atra]
LAAGAMTLIEATQYPGDEEWPSYMPTPQTLQPSKRPYDASQTSQSAQQRKKQRERIYWTGTAIETMLQETTLLRAAGANVGSGLNGNGWKALENVLKERHDLTVDKRHIKYKLDSLIKSVCEYNVFLKALSGWGPEQGVESPLNDLK